MTDTALHYSRPAAVRPRPLDYLPEMAGIVIFILMGLLLDSLGKVLVLVWMGLIAMLILARPVQFAGTLLRWWPLLLLPLLAVLSFYWSDTPSISARYGVQLLITALVGVFLARLIPPSRFVIVLFLATLVFCILSILSGREGPSAEGSVLIGLTGSKNRMGLWGFLLTYSAFGAMLHASTPRFLRLLALPAMAVGVFIVATTQSATAVVLTAAAIGIFSILNLMSRLGPSGRTGTMVACVLLAIPLIALTPEIMDFINNFMINVLHKDPNLTGRVDLWLRADQLIAQRPILGYGYQSFWRGDSLESREILAWWNVKSNAAFHFHHTYRQMAVDLGFVGMGVLIVTMVAGAIASMRHFIVHGRTETAFFLTMYLILIGLSLTDVVILTFSTTTVLFFACLLYQFAGPRLPAAEPVYAAGGGAPTPYATMRMPPPRFPQR